MIFGGTVERPEDAALDPFNQSNISDSSAGEITRSSDWRIARFVFAVASYSAFLMSVLLYVCQAPCCDKCCCSLVEQSKFVYMQPLPESTGEVSFNGKALPFVDSTKSGKKSENSEDSSVKATEKEGHSEKKSVSETATKSEEQNRIDKAGDSLTATESMPKIAQLGRWTFAAFSQNKTTKKSVWTFATMERYVFYHQYLVKQGSIHVDAWPRARLEVEYLGGATPFDAILLNEIENNDERDLKNALNLRKTDKTMAVRKMLSWERFVPFSRDTLDGVDSETESGSPFALFAKKIELRENKTTWAAYEQALVPVFETASKNEYTISRLSVQNFYVEALVDFWARSFFGKPVSSSDEKAVAFTFEDTNGINEKTNSQNIEISAVLRKDASDASIIASCTLKGTRNNSDDVSDLMLSSQSPDYSPYSIEQSSITGFRKCVQSFLYENISNNFYPLRKVADHDDKEEVTPVLGPRIWTDAEISEGEKDFTVEFSSELDEYVLEVAVKVG